MLRYGIFFMLIAVMTFLVLYDKNGDFNSLYRDIVTPLGWTTIKIVDEKRALAEMLTERDSWTAVEQLVMAATAIVIGVTIGWRAHRYCDGTYFQSDLLVKFAGKQKHIEERLNNLEVKMDKFEMKHSADTEPGDEVDSVTLHASDVSGQLVAEIEDRTSDTINHPPSTAVEDRGSQTISHPPSTAVEDRTSQTISHPSRTAVDETVEDRTSQTISQPSSTVVDETVEDRTSQTISQPSSTVVDETVEDRTSQTISQPSSTVVDETVEDRTSQTISQPSSTVVDELVEDRTSQTISHPSSTAVGEPVDDRASQTTSHPSSTAVDETVEDLVSTGTTMVAWDSHGPVECAEQDMTPEAEEETAKTDYEVDVFLYPIDSTEAEETVAGGAGECEHKASPQECRVSQFQVLRAADHEVRQVGLSSCPTRILEPVKILTEVTKLPRPNSARKLVPDGVAATTNGRRRKPRNFQMK